MKHAVNCYVDNTFCTVEKKKARGRALKHFLVHVFLHFLPPVEKKKARGRALKHTSTLLKLSVLLS